MDWEIKKEKFNKDYETQKVNNDELKTFFTDFPNDYLTQNWISDFNYNKHKPKSR